MIGSRGFPGDDGGAALPDRAGFPLDGLTLDRAAAAPLHRQLYELLRSYILEARLDAGSLLPATRYLAQHLGVGRNTVIAAYDQLLAEGYLEARTGCGTWVAPLPRQAPQPGSRDGPRACPASLVAAS